MSNIKHIEGASIDHDGWFEFDQAPDEPGPWQAATLTIFSDGQRQQLFTADQVRALLRDLKEQTMSMAVEQSIDRIAAKHGITLTP